MSRTFLTIGALALTLTMPAFAQTAAPPPAGGAMTGPTAAPSSSMPSMTCDQMMAKEQSMATHATAPQTAAAQNHMGMAQQAKAKGDEAGCKTHAQMAMDAMK